MTAVFINPQKLGIVEVAPSAAVFAGRVPEKMPIRIGLNFYTKAEISDAAVTLASIAAAMADHDSIPPDLADGSSPL